MRWQTRCMCSLLRLTKNIIVLTRSQPIRFMSSKHKILQFFSFLLQLYKFFLFFGWLDSFAGYEWFLGGTWWFGLGVRGGLVEEFVIEFDCEFGLWFGSVEVTDALFVFLVDADSSFLVFEFGWLLLADKFLFELGTDYFTFDWLGFATDYFHDFVVVWPRRLECFKRVQIT